MVLGTLTVLPALRVHSDGHVRHIGATLHCKASELLKDRDDSQTLNPKHAKAVL